MADKNQMPEGLDWVQLHEDINKGYVVPESPLEKIKKKMSDNPFVPIGAAATVAALTYGLICFKRGDQKMQQRMMRFRVGAQFFTVIAASVGVFLALPEEKRTWQNFIKSAEHRKT